MSMMLSIRVPVRRILAPFLKDGYLRFVDVIDLNSFFDDSVIVRECRQRYFGLFELLFGYRETVCEDRDHPDDLTSEIAYGIHGFQAASAGRYEVFDNDNLRARFQFTLNQIFQSVIFWCRTDVNEWQAEEICH